MQTFQERLKHAMAGPPKVSQAALARACGVKPPSVNDWLTGKTKTIEGENLLRAAAFLGVTPHWLSSGKGAMRIAKDALPPGYKTFSTIKPQPLDDDSGDRIPARSSAEVVQEMLAKHGKGLSEAARERIASVVEEVQGAYSSNVITADFSKSVRIGEGDILIPQYDVRASMGHGQVPAEYSEFIRNVAVSAVEFEKMGLAYESASGLAIITGWGQSMEPTINDKDPLIIDRGVTEFSGDGVYVLTWDGDLYIKRLQKADVPDHLDMISDNRNHKDRVVPVDDVRIHAKVLYIWNGKKA